MFAVLVLVLASSLALQQVPSAVPRESKGTLVLEGLDGASTTLAEGDLPLEDPRARGAWIVRPSGYGPAPEEARRGTPARVTLANGDELGVRVRGGLGEVLQLELAGGVVVPFDLAGLRSLRFPERIPPEQRLALTAAKESDRLYRGSGTLDVVDGTVEGFESGGVIFDSVLGKRTIPWDEVAALYVLALDENAPRADRGVPVTVDFAGLGGGRMRASLIAFEPGICRVRVGGKTEVALPLAAVAEVAVADGRLVFLSDLVPLEERGGGRPFDDDLGMGWPHRMDQGVQGGELRAGGVAHRRGIGMHAPSTLAFGLDGQPALLRGTVAIDDSVLVNPEAARGSVVFRVHADGQLLWESPLVRGGAAPLALPPLALEGKKELALELDPAGDFAGDRGDWLDLRLTR